MDAVGGIQQFQLFSMVVSLNWKNVFNRAEVIDQLFRSCMIAVVLIVL